MQSDLEIFNPEDIIFQSPPNVWVYKKQVDGIVYVVKKVKKGYIKNPTQKKICEEISSREHDHLIKIIDVWQNVGHTHYFIMMEHYENNLFQYLQRNRERIHECPGIGMEIFLQICYGLVELKVSHRDLKPSNILIKEEKGKIKVVLTDFAECNQGESLNNSKVGTYLYMAPQIKRVGHGDQVFYYNGNVDIWSLGLVLFGIFGTPLNIKSQPDSLCQFPKQFIKLLEKTSLNNQQYAYFNEFMKENEPMIHKSIPKVIQLLMFNILKFNPKERQSLSQILFTISSNMQEWLSYYPQTLSQSNAQKIPRYLQHQIDKDRLHDQRRKKIEIMQSLYSNFYLPFSNKDVFERITHQSTGLFVYYGVRAIRNWFKEIQGEKVVKKDLLVGLVFGNEDYRRRLELKCVEMQNRIRRLRSVQYIQKFFIEKSQAELVNRISIQKHLLTLSFNNQEITSLFENFCLIYHKFET